MKQAIQFTRIIRGILDSNLGLVAPDLIITEGMIDAEYARYLDMKMFAMAVIVKHDKLGLL